MFKGFIGSRKKELVDLLKDRYKVEVETIITVANRFLNGVIKFDMKWDMERCQEEYIIKDSIQWSIVPFNDPEWTYMFNRHKHFITYGQAYLITQNKKYLDRFCFEINDWIDKEENGSVLSWRTIECGLRLRNWIKALEYFEPDIDGNLLLKIKKSIKEQIRYIDEKSREDRFLSNWVILENHGVFIAGVYLNENKEFLENSLRYITKALDMQILDDGMHWEQSYMYHNEMVNCILDLIVIAKRNDIIIDSEIYKKVDLMLKGSLAIMQPNYMQPNFGDSDIEDLRDILGFGAIILGDKKLKNYVNRLPIEVIFEVGLDGYEVFERLESETVDFTSIALNDCGNYILRNKWGQDGIFTLFKCGSLGSGHGHFDMLHIAINYKGVDILVDSGRYNYGEDNEYRILLKEAKSHNTFILDDTEFNIARGSWGSLKVSEAIKREHKFGELASFAEGGHLGYIEDGAFVNRKIIFLNKGLWIVSDEIRASKEYQYKSFFNFSSTNVYTHGNFIKYKFKLNDELKEFTIQGLDNQKPILDKGYFSKEYNHLKKTTKGVFSKKGITNNAINYLMYVDDNEPKSVEYIDIIDWRGEILDSKYAKAIKITLEEEIYIVVMVFKEEPRGRKTYTVDGAQVYGRVVVIKKTSSDTAVEVLNY